jgi:hypothetical protein
MGSDQIREAISWGESAPPEWLDQYDLVRDRKVVVNFDTPFLRVAQLARAMKDLSGSLEETRVSPRIAAEVVHVYVHPRLDSEASAELVPQIESVVITRPDPNGGPAQVVRPSSQQAQVRPGTGAPDDARAARTLKATFPLSVFGPDAQIEIRFRSGETQLVPLDPALLARIK